MKKLLTLGIMLSLSMSLTYGATTYGDALKKAIKQDIEASKKEAADYNKSVKDAIKKDLEAKAKASQDAKTKEAVAKKTQKLNEINAKIAELNKQKASIQSSKDMTYTEKALKTRALDKQLEYYNKQKEALK